jgi:hypothetical protein
MSAKQPRVRRFPLVAWALFTVTWIIGEFAGKLDGVPIAGLITMWIIVSFAFLLMAVQ